MSTPSLGWITLSPSAWSRWKTFQQCGFSTAPSGSRHGASSIRASFFPTEAVLAKTISMEMDYGKPSSKRRLETQILHFDGDRLVRLHLRWNDAQTDAELVPAGGAENGAGHRRSGGSGRARKQTWRFPSRGQCLICHNGWAGPLLGFTPEQLNRQGQIEKLQTLSMVMAATAVKGKAMARLRLRQKGRSNPFINDRSL